VIIKKSPALPRFDYFSEDQAHLTKLHKIRKQTCQCWQISIVIVIFFLLREKAYIILLAHKVKNKQKSLGK